MARPTLNLLDITRRPVAVDEAARFTALLDAHHYLGAVAQIGHPLWYVATWQGPWLALLVISAAAWKCAARDRWIGWERRYQYDRLHLIANNSRFLILPEGRRPNLASRVLGLCERRVAADWQARFGYPLWLLETFVDPRFFRGTGYRAANWLEVGETRGYRRTRAGYSPQAGTPKRVLVRPLIADARPRLAHPVLDPRYHPGAPKLMLRAEQRRSLPAFFAEVPDPRRAQGRRHPLPVVLAMAAGAGRGGAGRAATRPSPPGRKTSAKPPAPAVAAVIATAATRSPAAPASAMCSPASIPRPSIGRYTAGMRTWPLTTRAWPSPAKPCVTPSTLMATRRLSSASSAIKPRVATPKKSRLLARRWRRRTETHP